MGRTPEPVDIIKFFGFLGACMIVAAIVLHYGYGW